MVQVDQPEWLVAGGGSFENCDTDVVDGNAVPCPPLEVSVVGVAVEDDVHRIPQQRFLEAARAEVRKDLRRLALHSCLDRRVVEDGHALCASEPGEGRLELERLVHRLSHESLDDFLTPGLERAYPEAAAEALDAGEADALDLARVTIEELHAGLSEDRLDLLRLTGFVVVIPENPHDWNPLGRAELLDEHAGLLREAVVCQVPAQDENVRRSPHGGKERLEGAARGLLAVEITDRGDLHPVPPIPPRWRRSSARRPRPSSAHAVPPARPRSPSAIRR